MNNWFDGQLDSRQLVLSPVVVKTSCLLSPVFDKSSCQNTSCRRSVVFPSFQYVADFVILTAIVVVATGLNPDTTYVRETEVIDLYHPLESCTPWADSLFDVYLAVGGFFDNGLVVCSGIIDDSDMYSPIYTNECFFVNQTSASPYSYLNFISAGSAGVMLDRESLLITGGFTSKKVSKTVISLKGTIFIFSYI